MHAIVLALAFGIITTVILLGLGPQIYAALGAGNGALDKALSYSNIVFGGAVSLWLLGSLTAIIRRRLVSAQRGTARITRCSTPRPQCAEARLLTRSRRVRPSQLPRQHNWYIRSVRLGQMVRRTLRRSTRC